MTEMYDNPQPKAIKLLILGDESLINLEVKEEMLLMRERERESGGERGRGREKFIVIPRHKELDDKKSGNNLKHVQHRDSGLFSTFAHSMPQWSVKRTKREGEENLVIHSFRITKYLNFVSNVKME